MLKFSILGTLLASALLACQPMTSEISTEQQASPAIEPKNTPVPSNKLFPANNLNTAEVTDNTIENGLRLISSKNDELGFRHMKYQPVHQGVPLWGIETIIHIDKQGKIYRVDGDIPEINAELDTKPNLSAESATTAALTELSDNGWSGSNARLFVFTTQEQASLVWQIDCVNAVKRKLVLVDANTGKVLKIVEGSHT